MEFESILLHFLHNTDAKMCLPGQESNNVRVGFNKHLKY